MVVLHLELVLVVQKFFCYFNGSDNGNYSNDLPNSFFNNTWQMVTFINVLGDSRKVYIKWITSVEKNY